MSGIPGLVPVESAAAGGGAEPINLTAVGGNPLNAAAVALGAVPTIILDANGNPVTYPAVEQVNTEGQKATYSVVAAVVPAATATDVLTISGSASKTIRVLRFGVSGSATTAASFLMQLIKRSAADTGGTGAAVTAAAMDSTNAAATSVVTNFSVNPAGLGAVVAPVRSAYVGLTGTSGLVGGTIQEWIFSTANDQALVLRGAAQILALNLGGVTITGGALSVWVEWSEE